MTGVVRRPAVAGYFYPAEAVALRDEVDALTAGVDERVPAYGVLVPHSSYARSGKVAGAVFGRVVIPRRCLIIGPSHTGSWMSWSLMADGAYRTPLGDVQIDRALAETLRTRCSFLETDAWSQRGEHAVEVQLPFLQRLGPSDLSVVPVIVGSEDAGELEHFTIALTQAVRMCEEPVLLIASSDLSHYQPLPTAVEQDRLLMEAIRSLDGALLRRLVMEEGIAMCGFQAVWCVLETARRLGARGASQIAYQASAETGGDPHAVIGYGGMVIASGRRQQRI